MMTAIRPATRNHDEETSTSLPATVPTLKVPGGRGRDGVSGTARGYPTGPVSDVAAGSVRSSVGSPRVRIVSVQQDSPTAGVSTPVDGVEVLGRCRRAGRATS